MPTMPFEFGDVVLVPFPFTSHIASKKRPAVVVSNRTYNVAKPDVVVMAITSQLRPGSGHGELWVSHWQAAALLNPLPSSRCSPRSNRRSSSANSVSLASATRRRSGRPSRGR